MVSGGARPRSSTSSPAGHPIRSPSRTSVHTSTIGTIEVRGGVTLRASPAREACIRVVTDQADMAKLVDGSPEHRREMLHGDVNEEIQSLEIAAQCLADFPEAPWDVRL